MAHTACPVGWFETHHDGTLRCTKSPKKGEGAASMHRYIQEHVMSILHPIGEHVTQLQLDLDQLEKSCSVRDAASTRHQRRLDEHEASLLSLQSAVDDDSVTAKLRQDLNELTKHVVVENQSARRGLDEAVERLNLVTANIDTMGTAVTECLSGVHILQEALPELAKHMDRALLTELHASHRRLCERHQGLARSHELAMGKLENMQDTQEQHGSLLSQVQKQSSSNSRDLNSLKERTQNVWKSVKDLTRDAGLHAERTQALDEKLTILGRNVGAYHDEFAELQGSGTDRDASAQETQTAVLSVADRLSKLENEVATVVRDLGAELKRDLAGTVAKLTHTVGQNIDEIKKTGYDIGEVRTLQKQQDSHIVGVDQRTKELDVREGKLRQWNDAMSSQLHVLSRSQQEALGAIDSHQSELDRAREHRQQMHNSIGQAHNEYQNLNDGLEATRAGVKEINSRVELAHEYLDGISTGLAGTHQHVLVGSCGMLRPQSGKSRTLPGLSYRRPLTNGNTMDHPLARPESSLS